MTPKKVLYWIILAGVFFIPLTPLIVSSSLFFPFITGKNFTFRIVVEIISAAWVVLAIIDPRVRPKKNAFFISLLSFVGVMLVADIFSKYPYKSFWSNYERMEGFVTVAHLAMYGIVLATTIPKRVFRWLLQTNLCVAGIVAIYGFMQLSGAAEIHQGTTRLDASLGNATYLAIYMVFMIFIALLLAARSKNWYARSVYGISILTNFIIVYYTATRGAILGLIAGILIAALLTAIFEKNRPRFRKTAGGIAIGIVVVTVAFLGLRNAAFVQNSQVLVRFASISPTERTTVSRFLIWKMAWQGFKESPKTVIIGWGQESFNYVFNKYYDAAMWNQEQWFDRTHNVVLDWLIAGGILGFATYLSLFGVALYGLYRKNSGLSFTERSIGAGLLVAYFIHNLFVFDNLVSYIVFFTFIAFIYVYRSREDEMEGQTLDSETVTKRIKIAAPIAGVLLIAVVYYVNVPAISASQDLIGALSQTQATDASLKAKMEAFQSALSENSFGDPEIREQLESSATSIVTDQSVSNEMKVAYFNEAKQELVKQVSLTPEDARYQLFIGSFLLAAGQFDDAITYLTRAHELSPEKQQIYFELGSAYINKGDTKKALALFKEAYDLAPEFLEAHIVYTAGAIYAKNNALATELLKTLPADALSDSRIVNAYITTGRYSAILPIFEKRVADNPSDVQSRLSLAALYLQLGDRVRSVQQLQEIIKIAPQTKDQMEAYIQQIQAGKNPVK